MADSDYRLIGLDSVAFSDHNLTTAGFPTNEHFTTITAIVPDSAVLQIEAPGKTELMVEDSEFADIVINTPAGKYIEFATRDMTPENFRLAFGGTTASTYWKARGQCRHLILEVLLGLRPQRLDEGLQSQIPMMQCGGLSSSTARSTPHLE